MEILMKQRDRRRNFTAATGSVGFVLIGAGILASVFGSSAALASDNGTSPTGCRTEVWRVTVAPKGGNPKYTPLPRHEKRSVLVCDEKVFAEMRRRAQDGG
jgi:hypothetical protein